MGDQSEELGESAAVRRGASVRLFNGFMNPSAGGEVKVSERLGEAAPPQSAMQNAIKGLEQRLVMSGVSSQCPHPLLKKTLDDGWEGPFYALFPLH